MESVLFLMDITKFPFGKSIVSTIMNISIESIHGSSTITESEATVLNEVADDVSFDNVQTLSNDSKLI